MRIALIILHADPARGGAERYTVDLAVALAGRGHDVFLIATSFAQVPDDVSRVLIPAKAATRLGRYERFLKGVDAHLKTGSYDVAHAMLPVLRCDVYHPHAGVAAESVRTGHLKHEGAAARMLAQAANRLNRKRRRFAQVESSLLSGPSAPLVLCLSEYVKRSVRIYYPLDESRLQTLFNAVDVGRFDPARDSSARQAVRRQFNLSEDTPVVLMIAQDFARKGLREAILALARVKAEGQAPVLLVVGKEEPGGYRRLTEAEGVGGRVIFAGSTPDTYPFYRAADFFILPTRHDPCSLVVLEALAMGLPVISTAFNGACEIMTDGREGFVLPDPADVDALAQSIRALLDSSRRESMSQAALALRPRLAYEHHLDQLLAIYARRPKL